MDDTLRLIRARYAAIQREAASYRCVDRPLSGYSVEGGGLRACFSGTTLRVITATFLGESGRATEQYFFWGGDAPFFVLRRSQLYTAPLSGVVARTTEERFYFHGGRLLRWLDDGRRQLAPGSAAGRAEERRLLESARAFARLVRDGRAVRVDGGPAGRTRAEGK